MTEHRTYTLTDADVGVRFDRLLTQAFPDLTRTRLQALIASGHILLDGAQVNPSHKGREGQIIALTLEPAQEATPQPQDIPLDVVFEDADVIIINKPAGMVVHPAPGNPDNTLVNALLAHCGDSLSGIGGVKRPGIVHRLDKGTSGLLIVAKNDFAHQHLSAQFATRSLSRIYQAIVWGIPNPRAGVIEGNIGRSPNNRQKMAVLHTGGKTAVTHYRTRQIFGLKAALLECTLETGRTHQIRVHLTSRGHPLIGDPLYGSVPKGAKPLKDALDAMTQSGERPLLHAYKLTFIHPRTEEKRTVSAPLPDDFVAALEVLEGL